MYFVDPTECSYQRTRVNPHSPTGCTGCLVLVSHTLSSPVRTQNTTVQAAHTTIQSPILSQSPPSCPLPATNWQVSLLPLGVPSCASSGVYAFTIFIYTYQCFQTELESFCTYIHRLNVKGRYCIFRCCLNKLICKKFANGGSLVPPGDRSLNCNLNIAGQESGREGLWQKATTKSLLEVWV